MGKIFESGTIAKIEWNVADDTIAVWKNPNVNFSKNSKLVVRETQKAVCYINGEAVCSKDAGEYTLNTGNIPVISSGILDRLMYGTYFSAEVYFVNLMEFRNVVWKTVNPIIFKDKTHGNYPYEISLEGTYNFKIIDPELILNKWVVPENFLATATLVSYITPSLIQNVTVELTKRMNEFDADIFSLDFMLRDWAELLTKILTEYSEDKYGVEFTELHITKVIFPTNDATYVERKKNLSAKVNGEDRRRIEIEEARHVSELERLKGEAEAKRKLELAKGQAASLSQATSSTADSFEERVRKLKYLKEQGLISEDSLKEEINKLMHGGM